MILGQYISKPHSEHDSHTPIVALNVSYNPIRMLINVLLNVPTGFALDRVQTHQIQYNRQNICDKKIEKDSFEQLIVSLEIYRKHKTMFHMFKFVEQD